MNHAMGAHFFFEATLPGFQKKLIVDPFGVPGKGVGEIEYMLDAQKIIPFFGESHLAPERHQRIYANLKPVSEVGYRRFVP